MKWILLILCLSGCVNAFPDNRFQEEAVKTFAHYNAIHHLNIPVPQVYLGATPGPFAGATWCPLDGTYTKCSITLNPSRSANLEQTLIHEEAHVICVLSVQGCKPTDHSKAWQDIALELGLNPGDSYINQE